MTKAALVRVLTDLSAESEELDTRVRGLEALAWARETPAPGWTVAHQIGHLAWTDRAALLAATDPEAFAALLAEALEDPFGFTDTAAEDAVALGPERLLAEWRRDRAELLAALSETPQGAKLPWFGPPMSAASMATARLMETWAHGQDVIDALGQRREPSTRVRDVCHIGVRARGFAFQLNGLDAPTEDVRVELTGPGGELWTWGTSETELVWGPAMDFALLVTQRRHRDELNLHTRGDVAAAWLPIAQAFAGPPGGGREPRAEPTEPTEEQDT